MRRWRVPDGRVLVETDAARGRFRLLAIDLRVERTYEPEVHSVEDVLYKMTYAVANGEFRELCEMENSWHGTVTYSHHVEFEGLEELTTEAEPTPADVDEAVRTHQQGVERRAQQGQADIDALASRPAATALALQGPYRRLAERVVRWNDLSSQKMLSLLDDTAEALTALLVAGQGDAGRELLDAAACLGNASLHLTFGSVPDGGVTATLGAVLTAALGAPTSLSPKARAELQTRLRALLDAVEAMQQTLLAEADVQDRVDARLNAAAYERAAAEVERAAQILASLGLRFTDAP